MPSVPTVPSLSAINSTTTVSSAAAAASAQQALLPPIVRDFDRARIEALLLDNHVELRAFADICGLSRSHTIHIVHGHFFPGFAAKVRIAYALRALGLLDEGDESVVKSAGGDDA